MRSSVALCTGLLFLAGCLPEQWLNPSGGESDVLLVPSSSFNPSGPVAISYRKVSYGPGDKDLALRVSAVGQQLIAANPEIGMQPKFATYGTPNSELFHTGPMLVNITEGLVRKCQGDGQLAALLAHELAQMVVEREALASPKMRAAEKNPPPDLIVGNGLTDRELDEVRRAELAKYEKTTNKQLKPLALPDPEVLTRKYLEKAGYDKAELEAVQHLLKEAERTYQLEKQMKQSGGAANWYANPPGASSTTKPAASSVSPTGAATNGPVGNGAPPAAPVPGKINLELPPTLKEDPAAGAAPVPLWKAQ